MVSDLERSNDSFKQVGMARFECRHFRTQRGGQGAFQRPPIAHAEYIDTHGPLEHRFVPLNRILIPGHPVDGGVG